MPHESASRSPFVIIDDDVHRIPPAWAVGVMADAVRAHGEGLMASPPRVAADVTLSDVGRFALDDGGQAGPGRLVMTAGRTREWFGYRVYDTIATTRGQQVVVTHDGVTGDVTAVAIGSSLGEHRTGALGAVALTALVAHRDRGARVAVIGAGRQAWTQLWAASGVLDIADVRVASRTHASADRLATRVRDELGLTCTAVDATPDAVAGADVVILATSSATPVVDVAWLEPDCVVVTLGPKQVGRAEFGLDLLDGAFVTTDSPAQLRAYDPPALAADADVAALADVLTDRICAPATGRRVHLSVGLAGTEVALLAAMVATRDDASAAR